MLQKKACLVVGVLAGISEVFFFVRQKTSVQVTRLAQCGNYEGDPPSFFGVFFVNILKRRSQLGCARATGAKSTMCKEPPGADMLSLKDY
jgi:hypothetical protein